MSSAGVTAPASAATVPMTADDARASGLAGEDLRRAARAGSLVRVRHGAYVPAEAWTSADGGERHRLLVLAAARRMSAPVFSHESAAAVWRMPLLGGWPSDLHLVLPISGGAPSTRGVRRHRVATLPDRCVVDGVTLTTVGCTVVDLARVGSFARGLVLADDALRRHGVQREHLAQLVAAAGSGRGVRAGRRVVDEADAAAESPGESLSRARIIELGLPTPGLQRDVRDGRGLVGRVDFLWEDLGVVGEFDGRLKYRAGAIDERAAVEDRVWMEKRREDRLRATGLRVVRWTWRDALDPTRLAHVLASAGVVPGA
ncbi:type IV toxin-antitoxin system AbiEi family antitoxin domain-containing protein [Cellulomonas sp. Y8]|uniref:type IV toxin-antitoxin system AbiEi family antitoxin domain-containing protein n=1 Tax=Cellulomonas sp. Y8 TaxID=2591145 RepID=UPI003D74053A